MYVRWLRQAPNEFIMKPKPFLHSLCIYANPGLSLISFCLILNINTNTVKVDLGRQEGMLCHIDDNTW